MSLSHFDVPNPTDGRVATPIVDSSAENPVVKGPSRDELEMSSFFHDVLGEGLHRGMVLNNIVRFEGSDTYDMWEADMIAIWNSTGL